MSALRPIVLERLRHVPGQQLRHRDFDDQGRYDEELLAWHQRAVHQAYGIVDGLAVRVVAGGEVEVDPGLAYDCAGHAVVVVEPQRVPRPRGGRGVMTLVLRRAERAGAELRWVAGSQTDPRAGVRLATFDAAGTALHLPALRTAGALVVARPHIAGGLTPAGGTAWEPWIVDGPGAAPLGLQVRVDTRAGGFTARPCYFAWLRWPRVAQAVLPAETYLGLGLQYVQEEAIDGFTFRTVLDGGDLPGRRSRAPQEAGAALARAERLHVLWLGLQPTEPGSDG